LTCGNISKEKQYFEQKAEKIAFFEKTFQMLFIQLVVGGVTNLQPLPEERDPGGHPQLLFEGTGGVLLVVA